MKKNKMWLILIPVVLAAVILIGAAGFLLVQNRGADKYAEDILLAKNYIEAQDFESAIAAYEHAITLDKTNVTAYEGLARVYLAQGDVGNLEQIIRRYEENNENDQTLRNRYSEELERLAATQAQKNAEAQQAANASGEEVAVADAVKAEATTEVHLDASILSFISGATYSDYLHTYGEATLENAGSVSVLRYPMPPLVCTYASEDGERTVDSSGKPFSESRPSTVSLTDLSFLIVGMTGETTLDTLRAEPALSSASVVQSEGNSYVQFEANSCVVLIESDENGTIAGPAAWNEIRVTEVAEETTGCELSGTVIDAVSGSGIMEAKIKIRSGINNQDGAILFEAVTDRYGSYLSQMEPGDYTVEISAVGYITEYYEVSIHSWVSTEDKDFVLSPELNGNEIRIVLEWGSFPNDLDSYLFGTSSSGEPVNINFTDPQKENVADLDVDCMTGFGPETTTIHDIGGSYQFVVADFQGTGMMDQSGATVKIYLPGAAQPEIVSVPAGVGNGWFVCSITNGVLNIENKPYTGNQTYVGGSDALAIASGDLLTGEAD